MYDIVAYGAMVTDTQRTGSYAEALRRVVGSDTVVLDVGTGPGILALLACQCGAKRVYAIEPSDVIQVAREIAAANGYADRIEFIQALSSEVTLPEQADVLVSDLHGMLPMYRQGLPSIIDARLRLLTPGGALIPRSDTLWVAVFGTPDLYSRAMAPWDANAYGLDMSAARRLVSNAWHHPRPTPQHLLLPPRCWATLDYATLDSPDVAGEAVWTADRSGTGHGLGVWFDSTLTEDVRFSNAPGSPKTVFGQVFLPWTTPVDVEVGDTVCVAMRHDLIGEDYVSSWNTRILREGREAVKAEFTQSTFFAAALLPSQLRKRSADHVAMLTERGRMAHLVLESMRGGHPLSAIAKRLAARYPTRFPTWQDALSHVGDLSAEYGE